MSEKEQRLVETLGSLPEALQDEFLAMAKGAVMMKAAYEAEKDDGRPENEKGGG